jgi:hypothetical protein
LPPGGGVAIATGQSRLCVAADLVEAVEDARRRRRQPARLRIGIDNRPEHVERKRTATITGSFFDRCRDSAPAGLEISAGEYGYDPWYFRRMLKVGAVDVLQADATRCLGITGFLRAAALADAHHVPLSAHAAPALHAQACGALSAVRHLEWFHDHVRIERLLFDGAPEPADGLLRPATDRPGLGLELKRAEAERYAV